MAPSASVELFFEIDHHDFAIIKWPLEPFLNRGM
jgi:hypothetical protein